MTGETRQRRLLWLWPMLLPVLPVLLAAALLQAVGVPVSLLDLKIAGMVPDAKAILRHGGGRLVFAAAVAVHTALCAGAMVYFGKLQRKIPVADRRTIATMVAVTVLAVLGSIAVAAGANPPLAAYHYSYFAIEALLDASPVARDLTAGDGLSALALLAAWPTVLGIAAVAMASGAVCGSLRQIRRAGGGSEATIETHSRQLLTGFYVLSAVLVSSTLAALLFYHLPLGLIGRGPANADLLAALTSYANGAATFWGTIYTLTLVAVYVGPLAVYFLRSRADAEARGTSLSLGEWCARFGVKLSMTSGLKNVLVLLAPLLVGPLGELVTALGR